MASFDTPQSSTLKSVYVTGTIPVNNDAGYIEIQATASRGGSKETFYRTFQIAASATRATASTWAGSGLYQIVISPKLTSTQPVTATTVISSFKH